MRFAGVFFEDIHLNLTVNGTTVAVSVSIAASCACFFQPASCREADAIHGLIILRILFLNNQVVVALFVANRDICREIAAQQQNCRYNRESLINVTNKTTQAEYVIGRFQNRALFEPVG